MQSFTFEQMKRAEEMALELSSNVKTRQDAIALLAHCLLCVDQQTSYPQYTTKRFEDAGTYIIACYRLSMNFPYTNDELADYIAEIKRLPPPVWT